MRVCEEAMVKGKEKHDGVTVACTRGTKEVVADWVDVGIFPMLKVGN